MKKLIFLLSLFSFSCFSVELYDCKYSEGNKSTGKFRTLGNGTVMVVGGNKFLSHDYVHRERTSPLLTKENKDILLGENNDYVFALAKDKTNYAIVAKNGNEVHQWDKCNFDSMINLEKLSYGEKQKNYTTLIKKYFESTLKDPDSAKFYNFSKPKKEFIFNNKQPMGGYSVCVEVNAKNSYGGYTGKQLHWLFFKDDQILRVQGENSKMISRWHNISCNY